MVSSINRKNAEKLVLEAYHQFSEPLIQSYKSSFGSTTGKTKEIQKISQNYAESLGIRVGDSPTLEKTKNVLEPELKAVSNEELRDMLQECQKLSELYNLPVRQEIPSNFIVVNEPVNRWKDNGNGTFTALAGATLWDLYGSEWREKSGFEGDPSKLLPGTVVGRNNTLIERFERGFGIDIKNHLGESLYNGVKEYIINDAAYPAKSLDFEKAMDFFKEYGIVIEEVDIKTLQAGTGIDEPWYTKLWEGTDVHIAIAEKYKKEHPFPSYNVAYNFTPIKSILRMFSEEYGVPNQTHLLNYRTREPDKRPDITDVTQRYIYEIKPAHDIVGAKKQVGEYIEIFNKALNPVGIIVEPGPSSALGVDRTIITKNRRNKYSYDSPQAGVILYRKIEDEPEPQPHFAPLGIPVPDKAWQDNRKHLEVALGIGAAASTAIFVLLLFLCGPGFLMPSTPGVIPILPSTSPNKTMT